MKHKVRLSTLFSGLVLLGAFAFLACGGTEIVKEQVIKEVPVEVVVEREVIKEVPVEKIVTETKTEVVTKEVIKEVPVEKEVIKQVTVEKEVVLVATATPLPQTQDFLKTRGSGVKYGGVLNFGFVAHPPHFDLHQSGTTNNCAPQCALFDLLVMIDPTEPSNGTIRPNLAHSWDVSADGKTFTYHLRDDVHFHSTTNEVDADGSLLTSADVKATLDKIIFPNEGIASRRAATFSAVSAITAPDPFTVVLELKSARSEAFLNEALGIGFNAIVRKKTLDDNNQDLRRIENYAGTGPFQFVEHKPAEYWLSEKNPDYWNPNIPYLEGIKTHDMCAWCAELTAAIETGRLDWARTIAPKDMAYLAAMDGVETAMYPQVVAHALYMNQNREPWTNPLVRQAVHIVLDREAMVEMVKEVTPTSFGAGFVFKYGPWAEKEADLRAKYAGYELTADKAKDIAIAKELMAEAGYADGIKDVDFIVRGHAHSMIWGPAIAQMLEEIGIETEMRTVEQAVWFDDSQSGNYDLTVGVQILAMTDPSGYFGAWYGTGQADNLSNYSDPEADALIQKINDESDIAKRKELVVEFGAILEAGVPFATVAWEMMTDAWSSDVKGFDPNYNAGIYNRGESRSTWWLDR